MSSFLEKLHHRSLFRVAAGYAVVAWVLIQASSIMLPTFGAPDWVLQVFVSFVVLGFPIALVLAWAFGERPESGEGAVAHLTRGSLATDGALVGTVIVLIGLSVFGLYSRPTTVVISAPTGNVASIAVLAFRDLSQNQDQIHFAEGISEEILNTLAQVPDLRVAARTSSFSFSGDDVTAQEIGEALNVGYVLEGSVRIAGNNMRITAQLINAETGFHLWSDNFDRQVEDIFAIQDDVANLILTALNREMGTAYEELESDQGTASVEAYSAYLLGRHHMAKRQAEPMLLAVAAFQQAIEIDPEYADAHAALGRAYRLNYGAFEADEVDQLMRDHLADAISIDPDNAVAIATLGLILGLDDWRFVEGGILARRAYELAPGDIEIMMSYVNNLMTAGRARDAYALLTEILEIDPHFPPARSNMQDVLTWLGRSDLALRMVLEDIEHEEDPFRLVGFLFNAASLATAIEDQALFDSLSAQLETLAQTDDLRLGFEVFQAAIAVWHGDDMDLRALVADGSVMELLEVPAFFAAGDAAGVYAIMGDYDTAIDLYERSIDESSLDVIFDRYSPFPPPDALYEHPRWAELVSRPELRTLQRMLDVAETQGQLDPLTAEDLGELTN